VSVIVTESPACATSTVSKPAHTAFTRVGTPEGSTRTASPGRTLPSAIRPQKPRKSGLGRLTHGTGRRKECRFGASATSTASRSSIRLGPAYHGVRGLRCSTLSPSRADSGIGCTLANPSPAANARYSVTMASNTAASNPTASILLTASTTCRMPIIATMRLWRRVCVSTPLRASIRMIARSAVDAPVAMLRVYCSCPGVSATM